METIGLQRVRNWIEFKFRALNAIFLKTDLSKLFKNISLLPLLAPHFLPV